MEFNMFKLKQPGNFGIKTPVTELKGIELNDFISDVSRKLITHQTLVFNDTKESGYLFECLGYTLEDKVKLRGFLIIDGTLRNDICSAVEISLHQVNAYFDKLLTSINNLNSPYLLNYCLPGYISHEGINSLGKPKVIQLDYNQLQNSPIFHLCNESTIDLVNFYRNTLFPFMSKPRIANWDYEFFDTYTEEEIKLKTCVTIGLNEAPVKFIDCDYGLLIHSHPRFKECYWVQNDIFESGVFSECKDELKYEVANAFNSRRKFELSNGTKDHTNLSMELALKYLVVE